MKPPPAWLESFQARFSSVLRAPLDRGTGTLRDRRDDYDSEACADARPSRACSERALLAVYNRQYWYRLLGALQRELPLCNRLLGSWTFNGYTLRYLEQHPPRSADLAAAADGFSAFLEATVSEPALVQAARIDEAFRAVLRAPEQPRFVPTPEQLVELEGARLVRSPAVRVLEEDWPLLQLRAAAYGGEGTLPLPAAHAQTQHWLLCGTAEAYRIVPLTALHARFLELLIDHTVGEALAAIERAHGAAPDLAAHIQRWLAEGARLNVWTGLAQSQAPSSPR